MKRSEMLNEMMSAIAIRYGATLFPINILELMDVILKSQEKLGMLPPCNTKWGGHLKENHVNNRCNDYVESCNFEWDEEDE